MGFLNFFKLSDSSPKHRNTVEDALMHGDKEKLSELLKKQYYSNSTDFCIRRFIETYDDPSFLIFLKKKGFKVNCYEYITITLEKKHYKIFDYYCSTSYKGNTDFKTALKILLESITNPADLKEIEPALNSFKKVVNLEDYELINKLFLSNNLSLNLDKNNTKINKLKI